MYRYERKIERESPLFVISFAELGSTVASESIIPNPHTKTPRLRAPHQTRNPHLADRSTQSHLPNSALSRCPHPQTNVPSSPKLNSPSSPNPALKPHTLTPKLHRPALNPQHQAPPTNSKPSPLNPALKQPNPATLLFSIHFAEGRWRPTRHPKPETRNTRLEKRNTKQETRNMKHKHENQNTRPGDPDPKLHFPRPKL